MASLNGRTLRGRSPEEPVRSSFTRRSVFIDLSISDIQCRYHYIRQKNSREQEWTDEEDDIMARLVADYKEGHPNWLEISETMANSKLRRTPRTALECKQRYACTFLYGRHLRIATSSVRL